MLPQELVHAYCILHHGMVIIEKDIDCFGAGGKNPCLDLLELLVFIIMGVPPGPAMDSLVDNRPAHDGPGKLWCIDADQQDTLFSSPNINLVCEEAGVTEFDSELLGACFVDESFQCGKVGEGGWELEQIVMDLVFQWSEECFKPLETLNGCSVEFLEMGNRPMRFYHPGKVFSFDRPGFHHVRIGEPVEAHVEFYGI